MSSGITLGTLPVLKTCVANQNCYIFGNFAVILLCFGIKWCELSYSLVLKDVVIFEVDNV